MEQALSKESVASKYALYIFLGMYVGVSLAIFCFLPRYASFVVVFVCFLPVAAYFFFSNVGAMYLLYIASIPFLQHFSFYFIELGDFKITPHMIAQFFLFLSLINHQLLSRKKNVFVLTNTDKAFLLFFIFSIIPLMYGYSLEVNHVKRWLLFYTGVVEAILFYFSLRILLSESLISEKQLVLALVATSFASLAVAVLEIRSVGMNPIMIYLSRMRIGFGYHNTNLFGIHSSILIPIIVYALTDAKLSRYRPVALVSFAVLLMLSVICFNRGTFLVLGFQMFLLYFRKQNRLVIYCMLLGAFVVGLILKDILLLYILRFFAGSGTEATFTVLDTSASYRIEAWKVGLLVLFHYPFGVGAGSFQYMYELYGSIPKLFLGTPHHLFLSIGVDYGVPCLTIFVLILINTIKKGRKLYREDRENNSLYYYIVVSLTAFILYGVITDGELSHLSGSIAPNNGYTLLLFSLIAMVVHRNNTFKSS